MSPPPPHEPYVPATESPSELTLRGLLLGSVLGIVFGASSVFLAVKVGLTVSASIPVAVLSIAVFRALGRSSVLENTIVQTVGSAGESLAFGVAAALPALLLLGYDIDLVHAFLVSALGGVLGVLMMIPLREGLIVQEHGALTYPEGTAAADVLIAGEEGGTNARTVLWGFTAGGLYKLAYAGLHLFKEIVGTPLSWVRTTAAGVSQRVGYTGGSLSMEVSPELLGVGYIIGPKVAGITFAGGVLSYLILIPLISFIGAGLEQPLLRPDGQLIRDMDPDTVRDAYVLYIGAGAVATGGLISLVRSLPTIVTAFRRGLSTFLASRRGRTAPVRLPRTERDLPMSLVLVGSALLVLTMWLAPPLHINLLSALLIVVCGFFFVTVSARVTGEIGSSSNPISGMVVATLLFTCLVYLLLGWTSAEDRFMALTTAAIVGIAASNGGTTAQDLKTAFLVGGTPRSQQVALFVGVLTSSLFIGGVLVVLNRGATAILPESHPGQQVSDLSGETRTQHLYPWAVSDQTLAARGVTVEQLKGPLWKQGLELGAAPNGWELRSWNALRVEDVANTDVRLPSGEGVKVSELGAVRQGPERTWRVGHVRGAETPVPTGTYLVDEAGTIQYVVDPGIGGRITTYAGQPLTRYPAPKAQLFALIIDGILTHKLPWDLVLVGVFIALMLELCGVSSLPFAVGVYLPLSSSAPIFVGGMVRYLVDRLRGGSASESDFSPGSLLSSGYIAGGAIAGVLIAFLEIASDGAWTRAMDIPSRLGDTPLARMFQESDAWGLGLFTALTLLLLVAALRGMHGVRTPAEKP
ncbi:OPT family oligopeptide transporter [Melittangium boletus]|uniref:Peptide transporter n=1 Tax=Melittangium boletus DSM 14713 TaxID=1294270 RepID=A0A250IMM9_9BACT|nr:oligopeptide transporter, OPT family [Melittangium boletus]ATB32994.1 peptide transporter [Melittangium boletus DSM 14713]